MDDPTSKLRAGYSDKSVLITGGAGFIGSNLAKELVDLGASVTIVDSMIPEYGGNLRNIVGIQDKVRVNFSDVRDPFSLGILVEGKDFIFNLAGQTSHMDSMLQPITDTEINTLAQLHILEAIRTHNPDARTVFASTRQIYGRPQYLPIDEKHPIIPTDVNGINKHAGESFHLLYNNVHDIWCTALRLTNTFGPHMRIKDARQTFLGIWIRCAVQGQQFEVWGGEQLRDFSFVDDTVAALLLAGLTDSCAGLAMNIGGSGIYSLEAVAKCVKSIVPTSSYKICRFPEDRKKIDIGDYYANDSLFKSLTGWEPRFSLKDGLQKSIEFYQNHISQYL